MTVAIDKPAFPPRVKRWTKREYNDLVERGFFNGQRLYLYRGELIEVAPMGMRHAHGITNAMDWLFDQFGKDRGFKIRCQMPFETPGESMPEPDLALVSPEQMRRTPHPSGAFLLIEVCDGSLEIDQAKAFDYAAAGVPDYWINNVSARTIEVFREPIEDSTAPLGWRFNWRQVFTEAEQLAPLAKPDAVVSVAALMPRF